jgi:hypothetical protein
LLFAPQLEIHGEGSGDDFVGGVTTGVPSGPVEAVGKHNRLVKGSGEAKGGGTGSAGEKREQWFGPVHIVTICVSRKSGS